MAARRLPHLALVGVVLAAALVTLVLSTTKPAEPAATGSAAERPTGAWVGTWATAPVEALRPGCADCTIRNVVHTSVGGTQLRLRLANTFGRVALLVEHTTVALPAGYSSAAAVPDSMREVRFGGRRQLRLAPGAEAWSDPIALTVPAERDLLVTSYLPGPVGRLTCHPGAHQTSYLAAGTDLAAEPGALPFTRPVSRWYLLTGVDVRSRRVAGAVVAFGDSITAGTGSTVDADHRWPDLLARRVLADPHAPRRAVLDAGIAGNRLLAAGHGPAGRSRLARDVLSQTGVRTVVVLIGINDIQFRRGGPDPAGLIIGYRTVIAELHAHRIRVIGATLTPFGGCAHATPATERARRSVNAWIRGSGAYDGVIDFDAAVRDASYPDRLARPFDSGDHLHPSDAGYQAMADAVTLAAL